MRASVIIPTRNKARFLALTLASLARQTEARSFDVIVVDDGSEDDTREIVTAQRDRADLALTYIRRAHKGRAAARNAAIRASQSELLIFCDDDRITHPTFVADHLLAHTSTTLAPANTTLPADAPRVVLGRQRAIVTVWSPEPPITEGHELPEPWWERSVAPAVELYGPHLENFAFPWAAGATGNLSTPRALVEQVGLFDEEFVGWGLEDTELHFRLHNAGARTHVIEGALNWHQLHPRSPDNATDWTRNAVRFLDKHPTLDVCLYLRVIQRRLTLDHANRIALEAHANPAATRELVAELVRVHREHFTMLTTS